MMNIKELVRFANDNNGMTYNNKTGRMMTTGYVCAMKGREVVISGRLTEKDLEDYMTKFEEDLRLESTCVGSWYNVEDGNTYLDTSLVYENRQECEEIGRRNGEIAIFCLDTFEEIRL